MRIYYNGGRIDPEAQYATALRFLSLGKERIIFHAHLENVPCETLSPYPVNYSCWDSINVDTSTGGYDKKRSS